MVIGITGNYCSGKNVACAQFEQVGFSIIDVDSLGHEALEVKRQEVVDFFGMDILHGNGIDRAKLGAIVFGDGGKMKELERIVHPWMIRRVRHLTTECTDCVINAALLVEMCLFTLCDRVIGILVEEKVAVERAGRRDRVSKEEALRRIRSQIPTKEKLHFVDTVIDNNGDLDTFRRNVASVIAKLR